MFTGIIQNTASVIDAKGHDGRIVRIGKPIGWRLANGASVSIDGVCSTVRSSGAKHFEVEYMPETLSKTTAGGFEKGRIVNLERSLRLNAAVDGHFVQGHVDEVGSIEEVRGRGASKEITVRLPKALVRYVAPRGSITIDGVSLTVARLKGVRATLALVSYTLEHTNLGRLKKGDTVNIETDLLARYLAQLQKK